MEKILTKAKIETKSSIGFSKKEGITFLLGFFGFFLGRIVIFEFINAISISYLALFLFTNSRFYIIAGFILLGILTKFSDYYFTKYLIVMGSMVAANFIISPKFKKSQTYIKALIGGTSVLIGGVFLSIVNEISLYFLIMSVMEGVLTFSLTLVMKRGIEILDGSVKRKVLSNEELISLAIVIGAIIAGTADVYIGTISVKDFFCALTIMIIGHKGGSTLGATAGVLLGFMLSIVGYADTTMVGILSICGMFSGIFKEYKKIGSIIGFMVGGFVVTFYLNKYLLTKEMLFSMVFAVLAFMLLPDNFYFNLSTINSIEDNSEEYIKRVKELTYYKLNNFSKAFSKLAATFSGISEKKANLSQKDITKLIDDVVNNVCIKCSNVNSCWEENFYDTYKWVFGMLGTCDRKGFVESNDVKDALNKKCINVKKFYEVLNKTYNLYKLNLTWHNRIIESRELVSQQLFGVSKIINDLANEINLDMKFNEKLEENIIAELNNSKIEVESVIVLQNNEGKYEVTLSYNNADKKQIVLKDIINVVSKTIGRKMKKDDETLGIMNKLRLKEEQKLRIVSGVARAVKDDSKESGDSYSFMELRNGQCLLALSDGMGSGKKAKEESAAAIELLEEFIESGFDKETAIRMINSVLVLKSSEETFSTLDICSINMYTGIAEFLKIGAASTFLIRNGEISIIKSSSLPMGILNEVDLEVSIKKVKDNDIILMVTDGIMELSDEFSFKEKWLIDKLHSFKSNNPQDIADYVLLEAKKASDDVLKDDMTVLAARIWEKI